MSLGWRLSDGQEEYDDEVSVREVNTLLLFLYLLCQTTFVRVYPSLYFASTSYIQPEKYEDIAEGRQITDTRHNSETV